MFYEVDTAIVPDGKESKKAASLQGDKNNISSEIPSNTNDYKLLRTNVLIWGFVQYALGEAVH